MFWQPNKSDRGFTIIELVVVFLIISIVAGLAAPSFISFFHRSQVNAALAELFGAIEETQRQAMRQGKNCRIDIDPDTNILTGNPPGCLLSSRKINNSIDIRTNLPGGSPNISFSHKGSTTRMGTIVLSSSSINYQKCFVISLGLGIMRSGEYKENSLGSISSTNCKVTN